MREVLFLALLVFAFCSGASPWCICRACRVVSSFASFVVVVVRWCHHHIPFDGQILLQLAVQAMKLDRFDYKICPPLHYFLFLLFQFIFLLHKRVDSVCEFLVTHFQGVFWDVQRHFLLLAREFVFCFGVF